MYRVSDEQIEFILNDIKQRGVEMEDLQLNLLDHICCILEQELTEEQSFEPAYQKVIKQFFKHELWEIEEETIFLLKYKNYYKMKRLLYILLFLSIGYNVFVFSRMGYESYKERELYHSFCPTDGVTLKEGYTDLVSTLEKEYPATLEKKFLCIYFIGDPRSDYEKERFPNPYIDDTTLTKKQKLAYYSEIKQIDSVAAIYKKNISFIYAYKGDHERIIEQQMVNKYLFKNGVFVNNQQKLYSGFCKENKGQAGFMSHLFILDSKGKQIYKSKHIIYQHIFLSRFLQTLTK